MKVEVICRNDELNHILNIQPLSYPEALARTLQKVEENEVVSSWKDSLVSGRLKVELTEFLNVPSHGCFLDIRSMKVRDVEATKEKIWRIGGKTGWYYASWLWRIRGFLDKLSGGVGLRRGRTHEDKLTAGDTVDFWRVLYTDREEGRLLLFAEMHSPGKLGWNSNWMAIPLAKGHLQT